ncbi:MAG: hypothetical protein ACKN9T_10395, partial [Candidatus Methylumidiphilus sp.]
DSDSYRLRFPHYLPILTQQPDLILTIKQRIDQLMQTQSAHRRRSSILTESSLATIRYWYDEKDTGLCKLVLVGGGWLKALENDKVGIADRLGGASQTRVYSRLNSSDCLHLAEQVSRPGIVLCGIDTLRWALRLQWEGSELSLETVPIRRITEANIAWWFEGVRALSFESPNALTRIAEATGGIPFFLEHFDGLLPHSDGSEVTAKDLEDVLANFDAKFSAFAEELRFGDSTVRLMPREIELITMLAQIAKQEGLSTKLGTDISLSWELCKSDDTLIPPYENKDDDLTIKVLIDCGILSLDDPQKQLQIHKNGIESRIVKAWVSDVKG